MFSEKTYRNDEVKHRNLTGCTGFTGWKKRWALEMTPHLLVIVDELAVYPGHSVNPVCSP
jgi:hypothetical protein